MKLTIFDASGLGHWMYHATDKTDPAAMLNRLREWLYEYLGSQEPTHACAALDGAKNWRKVVDVSYKANRTKPIDDALRAQLKEMPGVFESLGVVCVRDDECEADDIAATLVAQQSGLEREITLVTSDKDWSQLLIDGVRMFDPRPNKAGETVVYDAVSWIAKKQIPPHRMREYLALFGDAGDNVAGVPGWGAVNATNAINQTKSWPEIVRKAKAGQLQKITTKNQAVLVDHLADFDLAYRLVGLRYDAVVPDLEALRFAHPSDLGNPPEQSPEGIEAEIATCKAPSGLSSEVA